ncbi:tail protein [Xenorhabdus mauleonii]|uniref:Phage tail fibre repeat-containing protein n=1 Tax=Xenorhabdus mauleonii TaxID=351675 RepID=A0A1I3U8D0_9GAMM|nr:phage tail protein [Xenorhabdus mauleonii]PHM45964.1 tail protein [Xenorhabdus mauleonii]SFJ79784.1 Phage tail fibre repeat-containing protein [Xenorhabdus mauleonii]
MSNRDSSNSVEVPTMDEVRKAIKDAIAEHAASRNHPDATLKDKGLVSLSNDVNSNSETAASTPRAVKTTYDLASAANQNANNANKDANNANDNANTRLAKGLNGVDIPDKSAFVRNIGLGNTLKVGEYGVGADPISSPQAGIDGNANNLVRSGWYGAGGYNTLNYWYNYAPIMVMTRSGGDGTGSVAQLQISEKGMGTRYRVSNQWSKWVSFYHTGNTTKDNNGVLRVSTSIIQIFPDGNFTTNVESEGAIVERLSKGTYLIKGVQGFSNDGQIGGIEIPRCQNDLPLIWVNHDVLPDGSIKLMTYHREHSDAPAFARNRREGYTSGDLIDIPEGRFISVRVQMPDTQKSQS